MGVFSTSQSNTMFGKARKKWAKLAVLTVKAGEGRGISVKRLVLKARLFRTLQGLVRRWAEKLEKTP